MKVKAAIPYTVKNLGAALASLDIDPDRQHRITKLQQTHVSWVPAVSYTDDFTHPVGGGKFVLLKVRLEEKIIPAATVNDMVNDRVTQKFRDTGERMSRKEKTELKEDIIESLVPTALVKTTWLQVICDTVRDQLYIDTTQYPKAELVLAMLYEELDNFSAVPFTVDKSVSPELTDALTCDTEENDHLLNDHFTIGDACKLVDDETGASVTFKGTEIPDDEMLEYLNSGMDIVQINLVNSNHTSFTLKADLRISGLKMKDDPLEDEDENPDAAAFVTCQTVRSIYDALSDCFGANEDYLDL